jgi:anaerobic selenocysteine-containing dehydrogenase
MDHSGCGLLLTVENGRISRVRGDPQAPHGTGGYICAKGAALPEKLYSPRRLTRPLRRRGPRGTGEWEEVTWEEALNTVAAGLLRVKEQYGPEAVAFIQGTPKGLEYLALFRLAHAFGSPNVVTPAALCFMPRLVASLLTCGYYPLPDYGSGPSCILVWGSNVTATSADGVMAPQVLSTLKKKPKLIVVDPRRTRLAAKADLWLRLRPGSDSALAMAMLKVIVEERLYDRSFVENWTVGFDPLVARLNQYSLHDLAGVSWVSAEQIVAAARLYAGNRPACLQWGNALDQTYGSTGAARAVLLLSALCGNLEVPGGDVRPPQLSLLPGSEFLLSKLGERSGRPILSAHHPFARRFGFVPAPLAVEAMLTGRPYPLRAAYLMGTNPLVTFPEARKTFRALAGLDFLAVADVVLTPTALLADVVLPAATHLEHDNLSFYTQPFGRIIARPKVTDPPPGCRSDLAILFELARRLGLGEQFWDSEEACLDAVLAPMHKTFAELKRNLVVAADLEYFLYREKGFRTPSGKVEIASSLLAEYGFDPLPAAVTDLPELSPPYPLLLTSGKSPYYFHSANRHLPSLRRREPEPWVAIHPDTAAACGIEEGDRVRIATVVGEIIQIAHLDPSLHPRVIVPSYGWWFPEKDAASLFGWEEANLNLLTSAAGPVEPLVGSVPLRGLPCSIQLAEKRPH